MNDLRKRDEAGELAGKDGSNPDTVDWDEKVKQIISTDTMLNMHFNGF